MRAFINDLLYSFHFTHFVHSVHLVSLSLRVLRRFYESVATLVAKMGFRAGFLAGYSVVHGFSTSAFRLLWLVLVFLRYAEEVH
jgi:hypothetical protein